MAYFDVRKFAEGVQKQILGIRGKLGTKPDERMGIRSGFSEFDRQTRGFHEGKLYIAAGRPGAGKTSWVTSIMANIAMGQPDVPVLMFSTELSEEEIVMQIVESYSGGIPVYPNGRVSTDPEVLKLEAALMAIGQQIHETRLRVIFKKRLSVDFLNEQINEHCDGYLDGQSAFVIIDQANRIEREDKSRHGYAIATEHMLNSLEVLAEKQNIPVLLMTQLNRQTESQQKASMANLKHSGAFEEFAHAVYLLEKCEGHGKRQPDSQYIDNSATVTVAKNRHGMVGDIPFLFFGECHQWREKERIDR